MSEVFYMLLFKHQDITVCVWEGPFKGVIIFNLYQRTI